MGRSWLAGQRATQRRLLRWGAALLTTVVVGLAGPAGAEQLGHVDPSHDLARFDTGHDATSPFTSTAASPADITKVVIRHTRTALEVRITLHHLASAGSFSFYGEVLTSA